MIDIAKRKLESDEAADESASFLPHYRQMLLELVHIRRRELNYLRHKGEFSLELILEREWELDVEEARLKN
jgi:CPA1 family monovalent cation:H+ antiporter